MELVSSAKSFEGTQAVFRHDSRATGTGMVFGIYLPPQAASGNPLPVIWYLSGLTCTHANVVEKGGFQRVCAELGVILVAPDTSPRGEGVADDDAYDLGQGAGFYVDADAEPYSKNFRMFSYVSQELSELITSEFPADGSRQSITGHSMGGHGALVMALRQPGRFRSVSAFAPIVAPARVPWGQKALAAYLGDDPAKWRFWDATSLIEDGARLPEILVDQGSEDGFLERELKPELLAEACDAAGIDLTLRIQQGYDHSYYFVSTFMEDHLRWHAQRLFS